MNIYKYINCIHNFVIIIFVVFSLTKKEYGPYISVYTCMLILLFDGVAFVFLVVAAVGC
jgi:hypothetical protein